MLWKKNMQSSLQLLPQPEERYQMISPAALAKEWKINVSNWKLMALRHWETFTSAKEVLKSSCLSKNTHKLHEFTAKKCFEEISTNFFLTHAVHLNPLIFSTFFTIWKYIEDITWLHGDTKFLFECWKMRERVKYFFNTRREISYLQVAM